MIYVIVNENPMGQRWWTGTGNRWSEERPDAKEFKVWTAAAAALDDLFNAYPASPAAQRAKIVEEEKARV